MGLNIVSEHFVKKGFQFEHIHGYKIKIDFMLDQCVNTFEITVIVLVLNNMKLFLKVFIMNLQVFNEFLFGIC